MLLLHISARKQTFCQTFRHSSKWFPLFKVVEITQFISQALKIPNDDSPGLNWRMHLEHLNTILSVPSRARGLSTLYLHVAQNLEGHVGLGITGLAFRVHSPASELDFVNRKNEPLEFAAIVYLLLKMRELADGGLVVTYNGKLVNAVTQATVWIIFRFKDMFATRDEPPSYEDLDTTAQSIDWSMTPECKMSFGRRPNVGTAGFADVCTFLYQFSLLRFDDPGIRPMHTNKVFVHDWNAASGTIRLMESSKSPLQHTCMYHVLSAVSRAHHFTNLEKAGTLFLIRVPR